jgi:hypothetical protein
MSEKRVLRSATAASKKSPEKRVLRSADSGTKATAKRACPEKDDGVDIERAGEATKQEVLECYELLNKLLMGEFATGTVQANTSTSFCKTSRKELEDAMADATANIKAAAVSHLLLGRGASLYVSLKLTDAGRAQAGYMRHDYTATTHSHNCRLRCDKQVHVVPGAQERGSRLVVQDSGERVVELGAVLCKHMPVLTPPSTADSHSIEYIVREFHDPGCHHRDWLKVIETLKEKDRRMAAIRAGQFPYDDDDDDDDDDSSSSSSSSSSSLPWSAELL